MTGARLELEGITKRFGDLVAVSDLSLQVEPGEVFGFVGGNGAGKTTTMRIVLGVLLAERRGALGRPGGGGTEPAINLEQPPERSQP